MSAQPAVPLTPVPDRVLGEYGAGRPGPTVVAVAGMHGNEPDGITAARRVLDTLAAGRLPLRGRFVALVGNRAALARSRRFVTRDLNRLWHAAELRALRDADPAADDAERAEQRELLARFETLLADSGEVVFLDLHSTSAPGPPFHCISDTLHTRDIALGTPVPLILGVEEAIRGSLLEFMEERAAPLLLVESGPQGAALTADHQEAVIWHALVALDALTAEEIPGFAARHELLRAAARPLPPVVEVVYRHPVTRGSGFVMRPGFVNFDRVRRGDVLAEDRDGPVTAPVSGYLLMPLYQEQGDDGFFIGRPVAPGWLAVSQLLRWLRVDRVLPHLPGVHPERHRPGRLIVDTRVARFFTVQLFHLCGYRKVAARGHRVVFTRRVEGRGGPGYSSGPPRR